MAFYIGQKVVCVRAHNTDRGGEIELTKGGIYTVRWVGIWGVPGFFKNSLSVRLVEVRRGQDEWVPNDRRLFDIPFCASRFHPVIERKTDISIFTAMLTPKHQRVDA